MPDDAQHLLEATDLPIEIIANRCGFGSATALRVHFRRATGTSDGGRPRDTHR